MINKLVRQVQDTQDFLTMAAVELRRLAAEAPNVATYLRHVAQQLEAEAENLSTALRDQGANA
jgi:hypothetical protein